MKGYSSPELQYHARNVDELQSYRKGERQRQDKVLDRADSHLRRGAVSRSRVSQRIWPKAKA